MELSSYSTLIFDCDGVLLDSNRIKSEAFRLAVLPWGRAPAEAFVRHHAAHGGISRYRKFEYFLNSILVEHSPGSNPGHDGPGLEDLLMTYSQAVREGLMTCAVADGLEDLRSKTPNARWLIVSGSDQSELRDVFAARQLESLFDGGIFGSPDNKDVILSRELASGGIRMPALFLGDSCYDYHASMRAGLDFVFVSGWTEVGDWAKFVSSHDLSVIHQLSDLESACLE